MEHILVIAQEINQQYINQLKRAVGDNVILDVISGTKLSGNRINWIKSPGYNPRSIVSRLKCWIKHLFFMNSWAKKQNQHYKFIFAVSNPPINSYIGLKLKKRFKVPFIYMNWDLYPQIIETTIHSFVIKFFCYLWRWWNTHNYPDIDHMLTIGPEMGESIRKATKSDVELSVIPLGIDPSKLKPICKDRNKFIKKNGLDNKFIVLFSGKMGMGHNIKLILDAAVKLKHYEDIVFVFIGNGPKYKVIDEYISNHQAGNIRLFPWQDMDMYPYSIACGDIAIVTEEKSAEGLMFPSRVFSMMSCGEAIIGVCGKSDDLYKLIMDNSIGTCITNDSADELIYAIESLYKDKAMLKKMRENARNLIEEKYSEKVMVEKYSDLFSKI